MKFTRITAPAAVIALALTLAACGTSPTAEQPAEGQTLTYGVFEPDHLTPGRQGMAYEAVPSLFAPLVMTDDSNELTYVQAESVESDDATSWTITLRSGWTFHNGEPVTAESYVDAWNHTAYGPNAWENSGQLSAIVGFSDLNPESGEPTVDQMSGLTVVDDLTFTVDLVAPDSQFPLQLTQLQTALYPMPKAAYEDLDAYDRKPIGNGPLEMAEPWRDNEEFTATAYADYKGDKPAVSAITFRPYANQETGYTDVLAGNVDIIRVPDSKMTSAEADFGDRIHSFDGPTLLYLAFPSEDPRYDNVKIRQAVSMAIDRETVSKAIYGGLLDPATAYTSPMMAGTPEGVCGEFCEFNPTAAKALLAEAGGFEGSMELVYPGGRGFDGLMEAYSNQIRQNLGIEDVVAKPTTDWAEFWSSLVDKSVAGPHWGAWGALYPSQKDLLENLFTANGGCNLCVKYSDPDVDALLAKANAATSADEATAGYVAVQERVMDDFPIVPTFYGKYVFVTSDRVAEVPVSAGWPIAYEIALR